MRTRQIFETDSAIFVEAVEAALERVFGEHWDQSELAAIRIEDTYDHKEVWIATAAVLIQCRVNHDDLPRGDRPVNVTMLPWSQAPPASARGEVFKSHVESPYLSRWMVDIEGIALGTQAGRRRDLAELAEFAREYLRLSGQAAARARATVG